MENKLTFKQFMDWLEKQEDSREFDNSSSGCALAICYKEVLEINSRIYVGTILAQNSVKIYFGFLGPTQSLTKEQAIFFFRIEKYVTQPSRSRSSKGYPYRKYTAATLKKAIKYVAGLKSMKTIVEFL